MFQTTFSNISWHLKLFMAQFIFEIERNISKDVIHYVASDLATPQKLTGENKFIKAKLRRLKTYCLFLHICNKFAQLFLTKKVKYETFLRSSTCLKNLWENEQPKQYPKLYLDQNITICKCELEICEKLWRMFLILRKR